MLVEGVVCPINELNDRGWGVSNEDADMLIETLKASPLRAPFSRSNEHLVDALDDPRSEIGKPVEVWKDKIVSNTGKIVDVIKIIADIKDSDVIKKLKDGVWEKRWSIAGLGKVDKNGFTVGGYHTRGLTLVNKGAWDEASFDIIAASNNIDKESSIICFDDEFEIKDLSASGDNMSDNTKNDKNEDSGQLTAEKVSELIAAALKPIQEENDKLKEQLKVLEASSQKDEEEDGNNGEGEGNLDASSKDGKDDGKEMLTEDQINLIASTKASEAIKAFELESERKTVIKEYTDLMVASGVKVEDSTLKTVSSMTTEQIKEVIGNFKLLKASTKPMYDHRSPFRADKGKDTGLTVGEFDSDTGQWINGEE